MSVSVSKNFAIWIEWVFGQLPYDNWQDIRGYIQVGLQLFKYEIYGTFKLRKVPGRPTTRG